jgi:hypothetical protein
MSNRMLSYRTELTIASLPFLLCVGTCPANRRNAPDVHSTLLVFVNICLPRVPCSYKGPRLFENKDEGIDKLVSGTVKD